MKTFWQFIEGKIKDTGINLSNPNDQGISLRRLAKLRKQL